MLIVYDSMTSNVKRFVDKLPQQYERCHISQYDGVTPFVLITYTINFGEVPESVLKFLKLNGSKMLGVSASGNKNWGSYYGLAADKISNIYNVPILSKFELQGTDLDVIIFIERIEKLNERTEKLGNIEQHGENPKA